MRLVVCFMVAVALASCANAQDFASEMAWEMCQESRSQAHSMQPDSTEAREKLSEANEALSRVPGEYREPFQNRYDKLRGALSNVSTVEGRGDGLLAVADGQYVVIKRRVDSGNWDGVEEAANLCAKTYRNAETALTSASMGYVYIENGSISLIENIEEFVSMLEAFEDFYGPIP